MRSLVTLEDASPDAEVLVVTSGWPTADDPARCIFIKRQMESLRRLGLRYETLYIRGYRSRWAYVLAALRLLFWNLTRQRYRLVHCHGGEAALAAAFYRRAPLLVSYMGGDLLHDSLRRDGRVGLRGRLRCWVIRQHARTAAATITKSAAMEQTLPARVKHRNVIIPNGVDIRLFRPLNRMEVRAILGWRPESRVVLFAADPAEVRKRYDLALAGVESANRVLGDVTLAVAHNVDPGQMPLYMNSADCLIVTSRMEGSPNVVKEALMCNLPIVAVDVGDVRELLDGVHPSWIVPRTEDAVATALLDCLRAPRRSNGRSRAADLSEGNVAQQVLRVYRALASVTTA